VGKAQEEILEKNRKKYLKSQAEKKKIRAQEVEEKDDFEELLGQM